MNGFEPEEEQRDVFGKGDASERIVEIIRRGEYENGGVKRKRVSG